MTPVSDLADDLSEFNGMNISDFVTTNCDGQIDKLALIVLPEEDAREVLAKGKVPGGTALTRRPTLLLALSTPSRWIPRIPCRLVR